VYHGPRYLHPSGRFKGIAGICYIVGSPLKSHSGVQLRVADDQVRFISPPSVDQYRDPYGNEPGLSLAVFHAEPLGSVAQPLSDLRDGFIGAARDALDAGVPAVLVVPPLPDRVAKEVVDLVHRKAGRRRPLRPHDILDIAEHVRNKIYASGVTANRQTDDVVLDVLLFLRTRD
jgi:hypothetical protein